jgi:hypothetical protein
MYPRHWWLMLIILATQEAEIRRIVVQSHPWQIVLETLPWKTLHKKKKKNRADGVAQGESPESKPQYSKKRKKKKNVNMHFTFPICVPCLIFPLHICHHLIYWYCMYLFPISPFEYKLKKGKYFNLWFIATPLHLEEQEVTRRHPTNGL